MGSIYYTKDENYDEANFIADQHNNHVMTIYILSQILLYFVLCHVHM
jgi:hypothetical protein